MTTIKDRMGNIKVTRRSGYWLLEQAPDAICLSDDSMVRLIEEAQSQFVKEGVE